MLIVDQMPDLSRFGNPEQKIQALYEYVYSLRNEINHVLSNLDEDNLSFDLQTTIDSMQKAVTEAVQQTSVKPQQPQQAMSRQVGEVYLTIDTEQDPAQLFGGTWDLMETAPMEGVYAWVRKE